MLVVRGNQDTTKKITIKNATTKYEGLLPLVEFYSSSTNTIKYKKVDNNIIYSSSLSWSTIVLIADNFIGLPSEIDSSDIEITPI